MRGIERKKQKRFCYAMFIAVKLSLNTFQWLLGECYKTSGEYKSSLSRKRETE